MSQSTEARTVTVRAEDLRVGDVVVSSCGTSWTIDTVSAYTDRNGRQQVAATGLSWRGTRFSLQRRTHQPVRARPRAVVA